jgi:hypothetical protein
LRILPTGTSGFTNPVQLSVSGLPAGATATFSQNPVTPGTDPVNVTLTITTAARTSVYTIPRTAPARPILPLAAFGALAMLLCAVALRCNRQRTKIAWASLAFLLVLAYGCAGGGSGDSSSNPGTTRPPSGTPPGTSQLTVTAASGSASLQFGLTLTVQ